MTDNHAAADVVTVFDRGLAGRAGASVLAGLGIEISRSTVLRVLMA